MSTETSAAKHINALNVQKDKLIEDIKSVVAVADDLLRKAKTSSAEGYSAVRSALLEGSEFGIGN